MSLYKRKDGEIQPYWRMGKFQIRLPLIHYRLEWPELLQGAIIFTIGLSMIEIMTSILGMSYEAALAVAVINQLLMLLPSTLGAPLVSGFITPLIPLLTVFLAGFEPGPDAVSALIAVQLVTAAIFLILGLTGLGKKIIVHMPNSIKAGVLIGAGIAAVMGEINQDGTLFQSPISMIIGGILCLYIMFSMHFKKLYRKNQFFKRIANLGIVPAILVAMFVGWLTQEYPSPAIEWGITIPNLGELWNVTIFGVGFPSLDMIIGAIPLGLLAYIIAYGDIIVGDNLIKRAQAYRPDEKVSYDLSQIHVVTAIRGFIHSFIAPHPGLAGPIFTAGTASVAERYTFGKKAMQSIYSGTNSLLLSMAIVIFILPLITLFQPFLPIALSITLLLTGYLCITVGVQSVKSEEEIGVAVLMAIVLALYGAAYGLLVGIILYVVIQYNGRRKKKEIAKDKENEAEDEKAI
jgi:hypothetical protein